MTDRRPGTPGGLIYETPLYKSEEEARADMHRALGLWAEQAGNHPFFFRYQPTVIRNDPFDGDGPEFKGRFRIGWPA